jgi:hypothetical protein
VDVPWSGTKATGTGIANSELALGTFTRPSVLLLDRSRAPDPYWLPYDEDLIELANRLTRLQLGDFGVAWKIPWLVHRRIRRVRRFFAR